MGRFKPLFGQKGPIIQVPKFVDGGSVGYWDLGMPSSKHDILYLIPSLKTLVYADGTTPGDPRVKPHLRARRVREELEVFDRWVRELEKSGLKPPFRNLRPDPGNPFIFYCDYCPEGGPPKTFKIILPPKYPEIPPRTSGLKDLAFSPYRLGGEPCLGDLLRTHWARNWRRWGIAHFLAFLHIYYVSRMGYTIKVR